MSYSVKEAAEHAGVPVKTFRMHVLRGKVKVTRVGKSVTIAEDDLQAYMLTEGLMNAAAGVQGQDSHAIYQRLHATLVQLPQHIKDAILQGMPKSGRGGTSNGNPEPFRKAMGLPKTTKAAAAKPPADEEIDDADF